MNNFVYSDLDLSQITGKFVNIEFLNLLKERNISWIETQKTSLSKKCNYTF